MSLVRNRQHPVLHPVSLREIYAHPGDYDVKMLLDPKVSLSIESVDVEVRDADGSLMQFNSNRWGTKLRLSFKIDPLTPDGLSVINVALNSKDGLTMRERFSFWVIK